MSDFSKALSLSGLRLGWIIDRDPKRREQLINLRSYFTVSSSPLTEAIAAHALAHAGAVLARLREVAQVNVALLQQFMERQRSTLGWIPPAGGTVAFPWLLDGRDSRPICQALAREGVLVAPGDCFGLPEHFRIGVGAQATGFQEALEVASRVVRSITPGGEKMIKTVVLSMGLAASSLSLNARAQDERKYADGPVTEVDYMQVEYGHFEEYIDWLNSTWKPTMEATKKPG